MLLYPEPQSKIEHSGKQQFSIVTLLLKAFYGFATYPAVEEQSKLKQLCSQQLSYV